MKIKFIIILIILLLLTGCSTTQETYSCAICAGEADSTISGTLSDLESYGISINDCTEITSGVYTAHVCEQCVGPVYNPAENVFNPFE